MPAATLLAEIDDLLDHGRCVSAYRIAEAEDGGPLAWRDPAAAVVASRLLFHAGGPRAAYLALIRAHRLAPLDPRVAVLWARYLHERHGPYVALEFLRAFPVDAAPAPAQSDLRLVRAMLLVELRDFETADLEIQRAATLQPDDPWVAVVRAHSLQGQDLLADALDVLGDILARHPSYRPAVQACGQLLLELGRVDEAAALLVDAAARLESGALALQIGQLELSRQRPREAWAWFARGARLFPAIERGVFVGIAALCVGRRCDSQILVPLVAVATPRSSTSARRSSRPSQPSRPRAPRPAPAGPRAPRSRRASRYSSSASRSSRVIAVAAPASSSAAAAIARFFACSARIRSSTVSSATSRCTTTGRSCPIRCARSAA